MSLDADRLNPMAQRIEELEAQVERLRGEIKRAYFEGFDDSWVQSRGLEADPDLISEQWERSLAAQV